MDRKDIDKLIIVCIDARRYRNREPLDINVIKSHKEMKDLVGLQKALSDECQHYVAGVLATFISFEKYDSEYNAETISYGQDSDYPTWHKKLNKDSKKFFKSD